MDKLVEYMDELVEYMDQLVEYMAMNLGAKRRAGGVNVRPDLREHRCLVRLARRVQRAPDRAQARDLSERALKIRVSGIKSCCVISDVQIIVKRLCFQRFLVYQRRGVACEGPRSRHRCLECGVWVFGVELWDLGFGSKAEVDGFRV